MNHSGEIISMKGQLNDWIKFTDKANDTDAAPMMRLQQRSVKNAQTTNRKHAANSPITVNGRMRRTT